MSDSDAIEPHFYVFTDFARRFNAPPNGYVNLGFPDSQLRPIDKPLEMKGFSGSLSELKGQKGSINWKVLVGSAAGTKPFLRFSHEDVNVILTIKKLHARYFLATPDFVSKALNTKNVAAYIEKTKRKKPVYMVTGLLWTENAGVEQSWVSGGARTTRSFSDSSPFILGYRVRKIWWDGHGMRCEAEDEFVAPLDN
ncbi:hypothetical protein ACQKWADRAFT_312175 [Trichoderma austrokoningii]